MNATHRSPLNLVKQSVSWNNAKEQICNQCTSRLSRYLWFTYESGGIFPTSSAVARSRFLAGVAITNISLQLALLCSELDYLTYNPTSRHGTGYTFTWPRPTFEPVWYWAEMIWCRGIIYWRGTPSPDSRALGTPIDNFPGRQLSIRSPWKLRQSQEI